MTTDIWAPVESEMSRLQQGGGMVTGRGGRCHGATGAGTRMS